MGDPRRIFAATALALACLIPGGVFAAEDDATYHRPAQDVPFSPLASSQAKRAFIDLEGLMRRQSANPTSDIAVIRQQTADALGVLLAKSRAMYPVDMRPNTIAGVYTDDITPRGGVPARNRHRVLINLHGGGFFSGARISGEVEGVPIASVGQIRVVAVDYRQGPENQFPAASEDAAKVYKALLKRYPAKNIGVYGCSAGGLLTTEALAWFQTHGLPRPGAAGVFCSSASGWAGGDSAYFFSTPRGTGSPRDAVSDVAYFKGADMNDPLVFPIKSPAMMAKFPPTLVITGTRDSSMSSAIYTHAQLVKLGVEAELHVWEGVGHGFFFDPDIPESREAYAVIAHFFDRHLGR